MALEPWAAALVAKSASRWWNWITAPSSPTWLWSTWKAAIGWNALSSMTVSKSRGLASNAFGSVNASQYNFFFTLISLGLTITSPVITLHDCDSWRLSHTVLNPYGKYKVLHLTVLQVWGAADINSCSIDAPVVIRVNAQPGSFALAGLAAPVIAVGCVAC